MKRIAFYLVCIMAACSCNTGSKSANGFDEILVRPPFAALSDSIEKNPSDAGLLLRRAELLTQNNHHDIAYYDYKKSWQLQPSEVAAQLYVSNLFVTGRTKDAIELLKKCRQLYPDNKEFSRRLAEAYIQAGNSTDAMALYDEILKKDTGNFEMLYEKGMLVAQLKDTAAAIALLEKAWHHQPILQTGLALANLYAETRNEKTLALCDALARKDTANDFVDPVFLKGLYYSNINNYPKAMELFDEAIVRDWRFIDPYIEKGIILFRQKNYDEALKTFQFATNISYTNADNYYWMGRCYEAIGKNDDAVDYYYKALTFDKQFTEARQAIKRLKGDKIRGE